MEKQTVNKNRGLEIKDIKPEILEKYINALDRDIKLLELGIERAVDKIAKLMGGAVSKESIRDELLKGVETKNGKS